MTFVQYLRAVGAHKMIVLAATVAGLFISTVYTWMQEPIYSANVQMFVSINGGASTDLSQLNQGGVFIQQRVRSYTEIVSSPVVTEAVIDQLHLDYSPEELSQNIEASSPLNTVLLDITVTDTSAERARDIANGVATEFPRFVSKIETQNGAPSPVKISVTRSADLPEAPVSPRPALNIALGVVAGLILGLGTAVLRNNLDRTIRGKHDATKAAGSPLLGSVPEETKAKGGSLLIADEQATPRAEAFRQLRTNVRFLSVDHRLTSFVVTGSLPAEGKTTTAANFAIALAQSGQSVVLVDADLRRPSIADLFALSNGVGLTNVLLGDVPVNHALQQWRGDLPLYILAAGPRPPNPSELLGSARLGKVIASLESTGMTVIFDSPPLLPVTDAAIIARATGGALVVTRVGRTRKDQLSEAVESLRTAGATVLGIVANRVKGKQESTYYDVPAPRRSRSKR